MMSIHEALRLALAEIYTTLGRESEEDTAANWITPPDKLREVAQVLDALMRDPHLEQHTKSYEVEFRRTSFVTYLVKAHNQEHAEALAWKEISDQDAEWVVESVEEINEKCREYDHARALEDFDPITK